MDYKKYVRDGAILLAILGAVWTLSSQLTSTKDDIKLGQAEMKLYVQEEIKGIDNRVVRLEERVDNIEDRQK